MTSEPTPKKKSTAKKVAAETSPPKKGPPRKKKPAHDPAATDNDNDALVKQTTEPALAYTMPTNPTFAFAPEPVKTSFRQRVLNFFHRATRPPK
jgi:hypothetical protein